MAHTGTDIGRPYSTNARHRSHSEQRYSNCRKNDNKYLFPFGHKAALSFPNRISFIVIIA